MRTRNKRQRKAAACFLSGNVSKRRLAGILDAAIESDYGIPVDYYREVLQFEIGSMIEDVGVARLSHCWKLPK